MHLGFQATPGNVYAQINILQHRLNRYAKIIGLNALGLPLLDTASLGLFRTLVRVLIQFS